MDFYRICTKETKGATEIYPDFVVGRSKDLMVRGRSFYAIWDEERGLWSTDEYDVQRLVDQELREYAEKVKDETGLACNVRYLSSFGSNGWSQFRKYLQNISDNSHQLDNNLTFANEEVKKSDYVSRRLSYPLAEGDCSAWDELVGTLYSAEERAKIEWAIGAVVSGDSKRLQKFLVFHGPGGTGKSTIMQIMEQLFEGYVTTFEAKALGSNNNSFSTESFRNNPLVAIQHDGDLSTINDNTKLNSIISHENMAMNEKYKPSYTSRVNAFLFMGTNKPVKISDAKSGIIRRLIDVHPTGVIIPANHYHTLMSRIDFELGAIAYHCLEVYRSMGKNYYNAYRPIEMMLQTDVFFNFIEYNFDVFKDQDGVSLKQAYAFYKEFCADTGIEKILPQYQVREELRNYFDNFQDRVTVGGVIYRSYYTGFNADKFKAPVTDDAKTFSLVLDEHESLFNEVAAGWPAQLGKPGPSDQWIPSRPWVKVDTTLSQVDTSKLHYVRVPENHIVIDFDLRDSSGRKSLDLNLAAASEFPPTYAELSQGGNGVHLHYTYTGGFPGDLSQSYQEGIEVKTLLGEASLRRRLTKCNNVPIAEINTGLPLKEKKVLPANTIQSEKGLRELILRNLRKEIWPGTKPSIDFIKKILDDAYASGLEYDVSDMQGRLVAFANNSTNQAMTCLKIVQQMKLTGDEAAKAQTVEEFMAAGSKVPEAFDGRLVFFDVEVYPNLFVVCWKFDGDPNIVRMINPSPQEVEGLFKMKLVGFNNRRYDNHILYARFLGYSNEQLYQLSQKIISGVVGVMFGEAYSISYADIYDYSSKKQGLKKFQIELKLRHLELDIPWDQPVPPELVDKVVEYCCNDVESTEKVHHSRAQDFVARQILADLSGLTANDTTQKHTARIIFGSDRNPQASFIYTQLSNDFPGYEFIQGKSTYRGEEVGEGGYVYAEPGMYESVALLDVASMHPTSIEQLNLFGPEYTPRFAALKAARMAIKHRNFDVARQMLGGKLAPFLDDEAVADDLAYALKIVINIVYGLTSAKFDNPFRDPRNKDNIVAKRGALFMIDLKHEVQERGFQVVHIKTDSIKIPDATPEIIDFVVAYGKKYGYDFEHEGTYEKFCLVNDAVYIAYKDGKWDAVGAQFQHPYVYKTLFTKEDVEWDDICETKQVTQGSMYLDFEATKPMHMAGNYMQFVGRTGRFVPVTEKSMGGVLYRVKDDKRYAVTGTKGYLWLEAEMAKSLGSKVELDMGYFDKLVEDAVKTINKFGDFNTFA